jgi:L-asparaginase II
MAETQGGESASSGRGNASASGDRLRAYASGYVKAVHPVMREVTAALEAASGCDLSRAPVGTDGCSIPTYAMPLRALAHAFARVGTGVGLSSEHAAAARRLRSAVAASPFLVAGTGRFDTRVIERLGERVYLKVGAEGVFCASFPERGVGVAIKVDDGHTRAAEVVMASMVDALLALDDADAGFLRSLTAPVMTNWNGIEVGGLRPAEALQQWRGRFSVA